MIKEIEDKILEYRETADFGHPANPEEIMQVESALSVKFPNSYKSFLAEYGSGGILGIQLCGVSNVVATTEKYRKLGLDLACVVLQDCGEFIECLETGVNASGECPVVVYKPGGESVLRYHDFNEYFLAIIKNASETWEDYDETQ